MVNLADKMLIKKNGKQKAKVDPRNLNLSNYFSKNSFTDTPKQYDWTQIKLSDWGVYHNDRLNNCTCAAAAHMLKCWTANSKTEAIISDDAVLEAYVNITGYDANTGEGDEGAYAIDTLKYWRKNGIGPHKIKAFATVPQDNREVVKTAIYMFGGIYVGLQLPKSILGQQIWSVLPGELVGDCEPYSWGGHAVTILAYDEEYLTCITMGVEQKMTWEFWETYNDEAYAIITEDFFNGSQTPSGFNLKTIQEDLLKLTGQKIRLAKQLEDLNNTQQ